MIILELTKGQLDTIAKTNDHATGMTIVFDRTALREVAVRFVASNGEESDLGLIVKVPPPEQGS